MPDLHSRLEFATKLAYKAGDIMLKHFQIGMVQEIKADNSPVTIVDKLINSMVIEKIAREYPKEGVYGEEESSLKENNNHLWVCDPIDGTIPYASGIPVNVFTLAFLRDGEPMLSVVYDPYMKRLFHAIKGEGAFCNDSPLHVSATSDLKDCIVGVTGKSSNKVFDVHSFRGELPKHTRRQTQLMSFSYEAMMVALGQFDAAIFPGTPAHDVAPLKVIIEEAGGKVTSLEGKGQRYDRPINGAIISNEILHNALVKLVKPYLKT